MNKNKAIILVRTSTVKQEIQSQIDETIEYAKYLGFEEWTVVGSRGASAVKLDENYRRNMNEVKSLIETGEYKAVVAWHLTRVGRNELEVISFKNFLVEHQTQLYIKEPSLFLLNQDGSVNNGMELALSLHITLAKQGAAELKAKSKRAKERDRKLGKWTGGRCILFGYKVDENNFISVDPETSKILIEIFQMYATGRHSYKSIQKEINERYDLGVSSQWIRQKLVNYTYVESVNYPPLITKELFDQCGNMKEKNWTDFKPMDYKHHHFCNRLIRCRCGHGYAANSLVYRCAFGGVKEGHNINVKISNMDGLAWTIASHLESERLLHQDNKKEYKEKQAVLRDKIKSAGNSTKKTEKALQRAKECVVEGIITIDEYKARVGKIESDAEQTRNDILRWTEEIKSIQLILDEKRSGIERILKVSEKITSSDEEAMNEIVRRWIKRITIEGKIVTVETLTRTYKAKYCPNSNSRRWTTINGSTLAILPLVRDDKGAHLDKNGKFILGRDLPQTLAWLGGSEIV